MKVIKLFLGLLLFFAHVFGSVFAEARVKTRRAPASKQAPEQLLFTVPRDWTKTWENVGQSEVHEFITHGQSPTNWRVKYTLNVFNEMVPKNSNRLTRPFMSLLSQHCLRGRLFQLRADTDPVTKMRVAYLAQLCPAKGNSKAELTMMRVVAGYQRTYLFQKTVILSDEDVSDNPRPLLEAKFPTWKSDLHFAQICATDQPNHCVSL